MHNFIEYLKTKIDLTEEQINLVNNKINIKKYNKNDTILNAGDLSPYNYFVEEGLLRSYVIDDNGKEHIIQFGPENWIVSDRNSFLCKKEAKFYIQAIENSTIVLLDEDLTNFIQSLNPKYMEAQVVLLQNHVRHLQDRISSLLSDTAKTRYLAFIKLYPNLLNRVPQWMIASYLGITPESLSRVRKDIALHG